MPKNKLFILLPDGVGLRNFAFSNFYKIGIEKEFDITFWNSTPFDLTSLGYKEIKINAKTNPHTEILKRARTEIDLTLNIKRLNDKVFDNYRFPLLYNSLKNSIKSLLVKVLMLLFSSEKGVVKIRKWIKNYEKTTNYYQDCLATLKKEQPAIVFCTNQRPITAIAPILAAQDLGIPTAVFIFSWDNLPKASMVIETDFYFVWSEHMKQELLDYYPYIKENQIFITGTPQFERHNDVNILVSKTAFFEQYNLDLNKKYICFSGDDITTSPNDPQYLSDIANAIRELNQNGYQLGIIFRRCPVDLSDRFDDILEKNHDIITSIDPKWNNLGNVWNTILPTMEDLILQLNTIAHSEMVINLGSSMVFDFVAFDKPCAYINYEVNNTAYPNWSVNKIYNFVHFRSMPNKNAVIWLNNPDAIAIEIEKVILKEIPTVQHAKTWFEKTNQHPINDSSIRIFNAIHEIINQ